MIEKKLPSYQKLPFNIFKKQAAKCYLEIEGNNRLKNTLLNNFISFPQLELIKNKHGFTYLNPVSPYSYVDKETSFGDKLNDLLLLDNIDEEFVEFLVFLKEDLKLSFIPEIKFTDAQAYLTTKDCLILDISLNFMGFCEENFISEDISFFQFFGEKKAKDLLQEIVKQSQNYFNEELSNSFYNFLNDNKEDLLNDYFMLGAQDYLDNIADKNRYNKYEVLLKDFLNFADIPFPIELNNAKLANILKNWVKNKSIEDIMIFTEFYPLDESYQNFEWDDENILEKKYEEEQKQENNLKSILRIEETIADAISEEVITTANEIKDELNNKQHLQKNLFDFFNSIEGDNKEILCIDINNNKVSFILDQWGRFLNTQNNFKESFSELYSFISHLSKFHGWLIFLNHKKNSSDIYGFYFQENTMISMNSSEIKEFIEENSPEPLEMKPNYLEANIFWNKNKRKPKL